MLVLSSGSLGQKLGKFKFSGDKGFGGLEGLAVESLLLWGLGFWALQGKEVWGRGLGEDFLKIQVLRVQSPKT